MSGGKGARARRSKAQNVSLLAMMTALAFALSWIEGMFPPISGVAPGIKLGLANVVVLIMLYIGSFTQAAAVSLARVFIAGLVFAGPSALLFSLAGGVLSLLTMAAARRLGWFSPLGVSMLGGVFHNVGQIVMAMWVLRSALLIGYLPALLVAGALTGAATGLVAAGALRYFNSLPPRIGGGRKKAGDALPSTEREDAE